MFKPTSLYLFAGWISHVLIIFCENRESPTTYLWMVLFFTKILITIDDLFVEQFTSFYHEASLISTIYLII